MAGTEFLTEVRKGVGALTHLVVRRRLEPSGHFQSHAVANKVADVLQTLTPTLSQPEREKHGNLC